MAPHDFSYLEILAAPLINTACFLLRAIEWKVKYRDVGNLGQESGKLRLVLLKIHRLWLAFVCLSGLDYYKLVHNVIQLSQAEVQESELVVEEEAVDNTRDMFSALQAMVLAVDVMRHVRRLVIQRS
jgi:hypothetical protein